MGAAVFQKHGPAFELLPSFRPSCFLVLLGGLREPERAAGMAGGKMKVSYNAAGRMGTALVIAPVDAALPVPAEVIYPLSALSRDYRGG